MTLLLAVSELIGPLHPVLVHLPIGILLFAVLMQWLSSRGRYAVLHQAVPIAYLAGSMGAIVSCVSGWLLAGGGEYDEQTLDLHRWMGISVAVLSATGYLLSTRLNRQMLTWVSILIFLLVVITGHLGGTLTHGEGYLTKSFTTVKKDSSRKYAVIDNAQEAVVFSDIIQPVMETKCYSCHGIKKQKGGLRLDGSEWILKGGKDGAVISAGNPESSDLYKRVVMDPLEEKHMPPKGKPQLTEQERLLLHWWIASGPSFSKRAKELVQTATIKTTLAALESHGSQVPKKTDVPATPVDKAPDALLTLLRQAGVSVSPVAMNSNYLTASFVNNREPDKQTDSLLLRLKKQLIWLKMPAAHLSTSSWHTIASLDRITRLNIEHSNITDTELANLSALHQLQYLNLVDTRITADGLLHLKNLPQLSSIYLSQTQITGNQWASVQAAFPRTKLDSGGYRVSFLPSDTQILRAKAIKK